eukprot:snap_masked-scaffold_23-processed-gene-0.19-mRNA-1 protein AED:1.00 eAED:1.00 QI:0/-1/0/0/-1/1/1/0/143
MAGKKKNTNAPLTANILEALKKLSSPFLEPPCLYVLINLDKERLINFIVRAKRMYRIAPDLRIIDWISGKICYKLETHYTDLENIEAVLEHLESIEKLRAESRYQYNIAQLGNELDFPKDANNQKDAFTELFFKVCEIWGREK